MRAAVLLEHRFVADRRYTGRHRLNAQPTSLERASEKFEELATAGRKAAWRGKETGLTWLSNAVEETVHGLRGVREVFFPTAEQPLDRRPTPFPFVVLGLMVAGSVLALMLSLVLSTATTSSRDTAPPASPAAGKPCEGWECVTPTGDPPPVTTPLLSATIGPSDDSDRIGPAPSRSPKRPVKD